MARRERVDLIGHPQLCARRKLESLTAATQGLSWCKQVGVPFHLSSTLPPSPPANRTDTETPSHYYAAPLNGRDVPEPASTGKSSGRELKSQFARLDISTKAGSVLVTSLSLLRVLLYICVWL
ncbi:hypothetical protein Bbelb_147950 [Branchiostoma belcheri]|nr:hypothetical protein Bbelb_147950 [Branchiostoma belcheri]